jgi:hypothetical protein
MLSHLIEMLVWFVVMVGFAIYLNLQAKKLQFNRTLWTILGFFFTALAVSLLMYRTGRKVQAVIWLIIWVVGLESFIITATGMLSSFMPNLSVEE